MTKREIKLAALAMGAALCAPPMGVAQASSHREAPFITKNPKTDASDFYMFNSYESGRAGYVTIIANYEPLQDPAGGPNFYQLDPNALYEISIDNTADGKEDLTFQFRFANSLSGGTGLAVPAGGSGKSTAIPLLNDGPISASSQAALNESEAYTVTLVTGDRRTGHPASVYQTGQTTATTFTKPVDFIGKSSFNAATDAAAVTAYNAYVAPYMYYVDIPGCTPPGAASATNHPRVFVGQRQEGFAVNLGTIFDLVGALPSPGLFSTVTGGTTRAKRGLTDTTNTNPLAQGLNSLGNKNVTSIALEIPASCLTSTPTATGAAKIIGGWTTASVRQARVINPTGSFTEPSKDGGAWAQISRLGNPLVNEVVIGLKDKDLFNSSAPSGDGQFLPYVQYPSLPYLVNELYGGVAGANLEPQVFPRADLVEAFLTGVSATDTGTGSTHGTTVNVNQNGSTAEYLRLNTGFTATARGSQSSLGAAACFVNGALVLSNTDGTVDGTCDPNGFPNGRRPGDDVVDIALRVAMGYLLPSGTDNPAPTVAYTDYAINYDTQFAAGWPYLNTPYPGE